MPHQSCDLRPLSRGYRRETAVVEQIRDLAAKQDSAFWARMEIADHRAADCPRLETMVYFVRDRASAGRMDDAWRIIELMEPRIGALMGQYMSRFAGLSRDQIEDIERDVATQSYEEWLTLEPAAEFWEARFAVCLRRKVFDALDRRAKTTAVEVVLTAPEGTDEMPEPLESLPDITAPDPEIRAMIALALQELEPLQRLALLLRVHDGLTEEEIAARMCVTSRTVRNYLTRAKQRMRQWQEEQETDD